MRKVVLDLDTLSYVVRHRHPEVTRIAGQYLRVFRYFTVTAITLTEVVAGLEATQDGRGLEEFRRRAEGLEILPLGEEEAVLAGRIIGALTRAGTPIGPLDPLIAAIAIENGLPLVTNNETHYRRVVDLGFSLDVQNWHDRNDEGVV